MNDLVSVIMPIYNSEKYLKISLESIINQTYENIEIVLVNDGSTDSSKSICEEYARLDKRIKIINKDNGGNGDARNVCLSNAHGDWILWVDSDDIIHTKQIEILMKVAYEKKADIVVGNYCTIEDNEIPNEKVWNADVALDSQVITEKHLYDDYFVKKYSMIFTVPWCKLCKKHVFDGIKYPTKIRHVDTWTTWKTYEKASVVAFVDYPLYFWRINPDSLTRNKFDDSQFTMIDAYIEQLEYFYNNSRQRYVEVVFAEYLETFFWCYNRMNELDLDFSPLQKYLKKMRYHIKYLKLTKSLGIYKWLKYRYIIFYKIPLILKQKNNNNF